MQPDPFEKAMNEQLESGFPTPEILELGSLYWRRPRRNDTILVEMLDRLRKREAQRNRPKKMKFTGRRQRPASHSPKKHKPAGISHTDAMMNGVTEKK